MVSLTIKESTLHKTYGSHMNTKKITVWAEITASIAVVVGLGLLILEIRLNTRAVEYQSQVEQIAVVTEPFLQQAADRFDRDGTRRAL